MRIITITLIACSIFLSACNDDTKEFPGFEAITIKGQEVIYLYEPSSVKSTDDETSFLILKKLEDGYIIQKASTDCKFALHTEDGSFYSYNTEKQEIFPGSQTAFDISEDAHLSQLVKTACAFHPEAENKKVVLSDEIISNNKKDTEKSPSIEIPIPENTLTFYTPMKSGFLTQKTKARHSLAQDTGETTSLPNGAEVRVTGISKDQKWLEITYKKTSGKLYVPVKSVAMFSN